jgi:hypothetical protein
MGRYVHNLSQSTGRVKAACGPMQYDGASQMARTKKDAVIGDLVDDAMVAIEPDNKVLFVTAVRNSATID